MTKNYPYGNSVSPWLQTKIAVPDRYPRIGIVFYAWWRRYETDQRCQAVLLGPEPFRFANGELEEALRCWVYRLAWPRVWERMKLWLDKQGRHHPEWEEEFRSVREEWRGTEMRSGWSRIRF